MKLITELTENVKCLTEADEGGKKHMYIEGVFMQYDTPNRNGRIYSKDIMEREVNRYIKEVVSQKRAYGELNHPQGPQINLDRVSHIIEKLTMQNDGTVMGKAKIVNTPMGNIARGLMEGGANLGVSTRGLGSLKQGSNGIMEVQDDFRLVTAADIVADPSAPAAYVKGIMEGVDWLYNDKTGEWIEETRKEIRKLSKTQLEEQMLSFFGKFIKTL
jgi:hypothetical protein